jgi:hypothetical protein
MINVQRSIPSAVELEKVHPTLHRSNARLSGENQHCFERGFHHRRVVSMRRHATCGHYGAISQGVGAEGRKKGFRRLSFSKAPGTHQSCTRLCAAVLGKKVEKSLPHTLSMVRADFHHGGTERKMRTQSEEI